MNRPYPRQILSVSTHALARYMARVERYAIPEFQYWLKERGWDYSSKRVLRVLQEVGVKVEEYRQTMLIDANAWRRRAEWLESGQWMIPGKRARYVGRIDRIITAYEISQKSVIRFRLGGRMMEMADHDFSHVYAGEEQ